MKQGYRVIIWICISWIWAFPGDINWNTPESIDPFHSDIASFLNVNLDRVRWEATQAYLKEDFKKAAQYNLFLLRYKCNDAGTLYNLACCYGRLGEAELAKTFLMAAVGEGFHDSEHLRNDSDFNPVRRDPLFRQAEKNIHSHLSQLGQQVWTASEALFPMHYQLPKSKKKPKALIIGLHGNGGNAASFIRLHGAFTKNGMVFAAPQGAYAFRGGINTDRMFSWFMPGLPKSQWSQIDPLTMKQVLNSVDTMFQKSEPLPVFLLGFSQGAGLAYMTGLNHPEAIKGIVCFGGRLPIDALGGLDWQAAKQLPVLIIHGETDEAVSFERGKASRDLLMEKGFRVTFLSHKGGHVLPENMLKKAADWMEELL